MQLQKIKNILEAVLLSADKPLDLRRLDSLFEADEDRPGKDEIRQALQALQEDYQDRGIQLKEVASGYRMQVAEDNAPWVARLWEEKPPKYSRALLETLVLIAYRQPITRGEIEEIRGVSVSSHIIKTLLEREWVRVLGHKDVPGKPAMYGTTREFLDYFNLKTLDELPPLSEIKDLDKLHPELALDDSDTSENKPAGEGEQGEGDDASPTEAAAGDQAADDEATEAQATDDEAADESTAEAAQSEDEAATTEEMASEPTEESAESSDSEETAESTTELTGETGDDTEKSEPEQAAAGPEESTAEPVRDDTGETPAEPDGAGDSADDPDARRELQTG